MLRILRAPPTGGSAAVEFRPENGTDFVGADGGGHEGADQDAPARLGVGRSQSGVVAALAVEFFDKAVIDLKSVLDAESQ